MASTRYPAKFIPDILRRLIEAYRPADGLVLLDPFCGSGTTLSEAQRGGLPSIGIDLNPIAVMMLAGRRLTAYQRRLDVHSARLLIWHGRNRPVLPDIPRLDHWFRPRVKWGCKPCHSHCSTGGTARTSSRLVSVHHLRVSNQESDTRYAAIEKDIGREDVLRQFVRAARRIEEALRARSNPLPEATVIEADILALDPATIRQHVGLVVTSPPYPNAYEYWLYHRYRMWWLGFDPLAVKAREIGARAHFFKGSNSHTADDFERQMADVMAVLSALWLGAGMPAS